MTFKQNWNWKYCNKNFLSKVIPFGRIILYNFVLEQDRKEHRSKYKARDKYKRAERENNPILWKNFLFIFIFSFIWQTSFMKYSVHSMYLMSRERQHHERSRTRSYLRNGGYFITVLIKIIISAWIFFLSRPRGYQKARDFKRIEIFTFEFANVKKRKGARFEYQSYHKDPRCNRGTIIPKYVIRMLMKERGRGQEEKEKISPRGY